MKMEGAQFSTQDFVEAVDLWHKEDAPNLIATENLLKELVKALRERDKTIERLREENERISGNKSLWRDRAFRLNNAIKKELKRGVHGCNCEALCRSEQSCDCHLHRLRTALAQERGGDDG